MRRFPGVPANAAAQPPFTWEGRSKRLPRGSRDSPGGLSCCWLSRVCAPQGKHTAWAYCHVPNGSNQDMTDAIESQVERFAPGFRRHILARHTFTPSSLETYNANLVGGDIGGGAMDFKQVLMRPTWRLYGTGAAGVYLCSSSTPPGGGVHGMCGYNAVQRARKDGWVG